VCCSVLQRVAVCCTLCCVVRNDSADTLLHVPVSSLSLVAQVCCSMLQYIAAHCNVLQCVVACCSVLQRVSSLSLVVQVEVLPDLTL